MELLVFLIRQICYLSAASLEGSKTRGTLLHLSSISCAWTGLLAVENGFIFANIPKFQAFPSFSCEANEWLRSLELPAFLHSALQRGVVDDSEVRCFRSSFHSSPCLWLLCPQCWDSTCNLKVEYTKLGRFKPLSCEDAPRRNLPSKLLRRHRGRRIRAARTCSALDREGCNQSIEAREIICPPFPATWCHLAGGAQYDWHNQCTPLGSTITTKWKLSKWAILLQTL